MTPLDRVLEKLEQVRKACSGGYTAKCPAHDDHIPSLSIAVGDQAQVLLKCFTGCETEAVLAAIGLRLADLYPAGNEQLNLRPPQEKRVRPPKTAAKPVTVLPGLTLAALAAAKHLAPEFLLSLGISQTRSGGAPSVRIPYYGHDKAVIAVRSRLSLSGSRRFNWRAGDKAALYGLDRLDEIRAAGWLLLVEGESDCWTAWHHGIPALGVPGKTIWRPQWAALLDGIQVYVWQEPDAEDFASRVARSLPDLRIINAPEGVKDLSEAHVQGHDVVVYVEALRATSVLAADLKGRSDEARFEAHRIAAHGVLQETDPLVRVGQAIRGLGYGGGLRVPMITYLAATSRLLAMRPGTMPVHLLLIGPPSAGKSYTLQTILNLLPIEAYHVIDAGSPRVLIYDTAELAHRVVVFSEADSLPAGEDNPAASAVRNLLQDNRLRYKAVVRDSETGSYCVREIDKPGPSVLITTAIRHLGSQLESRVFILEVPDDHAQVRHALNMQARLELHGGAEPDTALIAFQELLQAQAPWDVVVPFAPELASAIATGAVATRVNRDFSRLVSLIKTVALVRHAHRRVDAQGRLIAELADYEAVYALVHEMYEATVSGASQKVRDVVAAVDRLTRETNAPVSFADVAEALTISKPTAKRHAEIAVRFAWLANAETRKGHPALLTIGDPLPEISGLPAPETLATSVTASTGDTQRSRAATTDAK